MVQYKFILLKLIQHYLYARENKLCTLVIKSRLCILAINLLSKENHIQCDFVHSDFYKITLGLLCCLISINLTKTRVTWEEGTANKGLTPSDWPVGTPAGYPSND